MTSKALAWVAAIATIAVLAIQNVTAVEKNSGTPRGVPPQTVADYLHAVIIAHREFYTIHIANRLLQEGIVDVSENWRATNSLPLPVQFLKETSEMVELSGTHVYYHLISPWPINKGNGPVTEFERRGLKEIQMHPQQPYYGFIGGAGEQSFGAIYADLAVTRVCIDCHNTHPDSPKKDFDIDDVMGGLVISFPLSH